MYQEFNNYINYVFSCFFLSGDGYWNIGSDPTKTTGWIKTNKKGLVNLPVTGWEYSAPKWTLDPQIMFV